MIKKVKKAFDTLDQMTYNENTVRVMLFIKDNPHTNVSGIYKSLDLEQSVTSAILSKLRSFNVVTGERAGKSILYSINAQVVSERLDTIKGALTQ